MTDSPSILIVEDEPLISMMLEDYLDSLGYRIAGAADTLGDALGRVEAGGFDGVILDVNLKDHQASWPIADRLAEKGLPFVLATGGGDRRPERHEGAPLLAKPYTMDGVRHAMQTLFGAR